MIKKLLFRASWAFFVLFAACEVQAKEQNLTLQIETLKIEEVEIKTQPYNSPLETFFKVKLKNGLMQNGSTADRQYHGSLQEIATFEVWKDGVNVGAYTSDLFEQNGGIETYIEKIVFKDGKVVFTIANVQDGIVPHLSGKLHENGKAIRQIKIK